MVINMKKFAFILIALSFALTVLSSCGGNQEVSASVPVADIVSEIDTLLSNADKLSAVDDDYVKGMFEIDTAMLDEYVLKIQVSGTEIDQYGIFKTADEANISAVETALNGYIDTVKTNWNNFNYLPEEKTKLDNASVETIGNYVIFTVLSEDESAAVIDKINEILTSK